jgi:hypothetical protein
MRSFVHTLRGLVLIATVTIVSRTARADVVVPDYGYFGSSTGVYQFNQSTGAPVGGQPVIQPVGSASNPYDPGYEGDGYQAEGSAYGPDGNLYVGYFIAAGNGGTGIGEVRQFNAVTGAYMSTFVAPGAGGLVQPGNLAFNNGTLYVADHGNTLDQQTFYGATSVYQYSAATGANTGAINFGAPVSPSGLQFDPRPASMGGDPNNLYISLFNANEVVQYNTVTHNITTFAAGGGMFTPSGIAFGPNGDLYVVNLFTAQVQEFHPNNSGTSDYVKNLPSTGDNSFPNGIAFTQGGQFLVSTLGPGVAPGAVLSYNSGTSAWDTFFTSPTLGSPGPLTITPIAGDGNADGIVNSQDIALVSSNWLAAGPTGDVNHDGIVNSQDLALISSNWLNNNSIYNAAPASAVPEPSTIALGLGGAALLAARRARRQR